jgi:hypothetical protein
MLGMAGREQAADVASERDIEAANVAHQRRGELSDRDFKQSLLSNAISRTGAMEDWRTKQAEMPITLNDLRVNQAMNLPQGSPEWQRTVGVTPEQIPSVTEQEAMILSQFEPGSPEWQQAYQQIIDMKRQQPTQLDQMLDWQRLARGSRELGIYGQMGNEMKEQAGVGAFAQRGLNTIMGQPQGQFQIGQIITNPQGQQGRVVGFNPDGTPLIEPL